MQVLERRRRGELKVTQAIPIRTAIAATTSNASEAAPTVTNCSDNAPVLLASCWATGSAGKIDLKLNAKGAPYCKGIGSMVREHANANSGARIALTGKNSPAAICSQ
jgi:hypothetical protein